MKITSLRDLNRKNHEQIQGLLVHGDVEWFVNYVSNAAVKLLSSSSATVYKATSLIGLEEVLSHRSNDIFGGGQTQDIDTILCVQPNLKISDVKETIGVCFEQKKKIVLSTSYLRPNSALRKKFEEGGQLLCLPVFEPNEMHIKEYIQDFFAPTRINDDVLGFIQDQMRFQSESLPAFLQICQLYAHDGRVDGTVVRDCVRASVNFTPEVQKMAEAVITQDVVFLYNHITKIESVTTTLSFLSALQDACFLLILLKKRYISPSDPSLFRWKAIKSNSKDWSIEGLTQVLRWCVDQEVITKRTGKINFLEVLVFLGGPNVRR